MSTYTSTSTVSHDISDAFSFIKDPTNLPSFFPRITQAELIAPELVRTTAVVDEDADGNEEPVTSEAWFRIDEDSQSIAWGSPGASDYHGALNLEGSAGQTHLNLSVTTVHDHPGVQESLDQALSAIANRLDALSSAPDTTE